MPEQCPIGLDLAHAATVLQRGGLVGIPTETVYGLAANAFDVAAVARVFEAKGRPTFDPLIVHLHDQAELPRVARAVPPAARELAGRFWPGPLTLVVPRQPAVPDLVTSGLDTVAVRIPEHPLARELIQRAGVPLAAPSANLFGRISPTTAAHVADQLGTRIDYIVDGGPCRVGVESTVVDCTGSGRPRLLRPGGVSLEELVAVIGPLEFAATPDQAHAQPLSSPGQLPQHYAPRTPLGIVDSAWHLVGESAQSRVGYLAFQTVPAGDFAAWEVLSPTGDLREAAAGFFAALRRLDAAELDVIWADPFPAAGLGRALNDRLQRAAHA